MQIANPPPSGAPAPAPIAGTHFLSTTEGELTLAILALGVLVILAMSFVLRSKSASADDAIRAYSITLIIIGTMVLICAGYSNDQIAPAMGLFGTVAGYLLGERQALHEAQLLGFAYTGHLAIDRGNGNRSDASEKDQHW